MKVVLNRHAFSDAFVERIRTAIPPSIHIVETRIMDKKNLSPDILLVLYGSRRTEHHQEVLIQWTHRTSSYFRVKLTDLAVWFEKAI